MYEGRHYHQHHTGQDCTSCRTGPWMFQEEGSVASSARMQQTIFWKRMGIDIVRSSSEKECLYFDVRLIAVQNGQTGRHEVCVHVVNEG